MKNLDDITRPIAPELARFEAFFAQTLKAESEPMDSIMRYVADTRGKRLRPILVLLGAMLYGEVNESTLRAATFVEMVHSATLIHDDVVDGDDLRRNQPSVKALWDSRSAVLAGDYLLARAILLISRPEDHKIMQEMLRTSAAMSEGELMQNAQQPNYIDIITRKTATLMRSCCAAGAMSVGASDDEVLRVADFGLNFGILFQLRDDLLDGENTEQAQALLPNYYNKTLQALEALPHTPAAEALRELAVFCAEREG